MSRRTPRKSFAFRFLLDENLSDTVAVVARNLGLDVESVYGRQLANIDDERLLVRAAIDGRILVTRNRDHFLKLSREFTAADKPHAGVLVVPRSIPGHRPEPLAYALLGWAKRMSAVLGGRPLEPYSLHYLSPSDALHGRED